MYMYLYLYWKSFYKMGDFWSISWPPTFCYFPISVSQMKSWCRLETSRVTSVRICYQSVANPGFPAGVCGPRRGDMDSRGGYVMKILYVKTKESRPLGGRAPGICQCRSANANGWRTLGLEKLWDRLFIGQKVFNMLYCNSSTHFF